MSAIHHLDAVHKQPAHFASYRSVRPLTFLVWLSALLLFGLVEAGACVFEPTSVPLSAGESWRGHLWSGADSACFVVDVPEAGLLAIELAQRADAPRAYLSLGDAEPRGADSHRIVRRTAGLLLLDAAPGRQSFSVRDVGVHGAGEGRTTFRVTTRFVVQSEVRSKGEYDTEIEIEPIDKGEYDTEIEIEPIDKLTADLGSIPELDSIQLDALCDSSSGTEPGGSLLCARPLAWSAPARGQLATHRIDEAHAYRFDVTAVGPVAVRARTLPRSDDVAIELLDRSGQRLGAWTTEDRGAERVVVLVPGTYFVRLLSLQGGRAGYVLRLEGPAAD